MTINPIEARQKLDITRCLGEEILNTIEAFEKEHGIMINTLYWGIGFRDDYVDDGKIIWGDKNRRDITIEFGVAEKGN